MLVSPETGLDDQGEAVTGGYRKLALRGEPGAHSARACFIETSTSGRGVARQGEHS
jgi:hypothetical protein